VVQDPSDAAFSDMPVNALKRLTPDHVVTLEAMPQLFVSLALEPAGQPMPVPKSIGFEIEIAKGRHATIDDMDQIGRRSGFACPDCHGAMWEIDEEELVRFRCHVGHTYTAELMSMALDENLRRVLGSALRVLEERRALSRNLELKAEQDGQPHLAVTWAQRADEFQRELSVIRESIERVDKIAA
jgi:two-component system chemotaxis response regulator CheB